LRFTNVTTDFMGYRCRPPAVRVPSGITTSQNVAPRWSQKRLPTMNQHASAALASTRTKK